MMDKKQEDLIISNPSDFSVSFNSESISLHNVRDHTFIIGLKEILPEDILWRTKHPRVPSLICFQEDHSCDCPSNCIPKMASRSFWLFSRFEKLRQILILFKRNEKPLVRDKYVRLTPGGDVMLSYKGGHQNDIPKETVPRVWALLIKNDFYNSPVPYRIFRVNHNGLRLVLRKVEKLVINVDVGFWSGCF